MRAMAYMSGTFLSLSHEPLVSNSGCMTTNALVQLFIFAVLALH